MEATGQCQRLHALVPTIVKDVAGVITVPYMFVLWLVLPVLTIADDMLDVCWTHEVVGCELLGAALDELLMLHEGEGAAARVRRGRAGE